MTALAVGAAMLPVAIAPPPATEQFRNIATAITGGLITSTLMTLVVIPVAYMLMDDMIALIKRIYLVERTPVVDAAQVDALVSSPAASDPGLAPALGTDSSSGEGTDQETTVRTGHDKADAAE